MPIRGSDTRDIARNGRLELGFRHWFALAASTLGRRPSRHPAPIRPSSVGPPRGLQRRRLANARAAIANRKQVPPRHAATGCWNHDACGRQLVVCASVFLHVRLLPVLGRGVKLRWPSASNAKPMLDGQRGSPGLDSPMPHASAPENQCRAASFDKGHAWLTSGLPLLRAQDNGEERRAST